MGQMHEKTLTSIRQINFPCGMWTQSSPRNTITETWSIVSDVTLDGKSVVTSTKDSSEIFSESLRILLMKGKVFYLAYVSHNPFPVPYELREFSEGKWVFQNPDHDFPKTITYTLRSSGTLHVVALGTDEKNGQEKKLTLSFTKVLAGE